MTVGPGGADGWAAPGRAEPDPGPPAATGSWTGPAGSRDAEPPAYGVPAGWRGPGGWGDRPPDPKPGIVPLRPLAVGELLDGSFTCIRSYPRATLGLAAMVVTLTQVVQLLATLLLFHGTRTFDPTTVDGSVDAAAVIRFAAQVGSVALVAAVVSGLGTLVLTGMLTAVVGRAVLGQPVSMAQAWQAVRPALWRLAGVAMLTGLIVLAVLVGCLLPGLVLLVTGVARPAAVGLLVLGAGIGVGLAVATYVSLALATPAVVLERARVRAALGRSRLLVRGSWWRVFWVLVLAAVIAGVLGNILALPFTLLRGGTGSLLDPASLDASVPSLLLAAVGGIVAQTIVAPFQAGVRALLYVDRRMRAEGLDVVLTAAAGGAPPRPAGPGPAAGPGPGPAGPGW